MDEQGEINVHRPPSEKELIEIYKKQIEDFYWEFSYSRYRNNNLFSVALLESLNATYNYDDYGIISYASFLFRPDLTFHYPAHCPDHHVQAAILKFHKLFLTYHDKVFCFDCFFYHITTYDLDFYIELYYFCHEMNTEMSTYAGPRLRQKIIDRATVEVSQEFANDLQNHFDQHDDKEQALNFVVELRRNEDHNNVNPGRVEDDDRLPTFVMMSFLMIFLIVFLGSSLVQNNLKNNHQCHCKISTAENCLSWPWYI